MKHIQFQSLETKYTIICDGGKVLFLKWSLAWWSLLNDVMGSLLVPKLCLSWNFKEKLLYFWLYSIYHPALSLHHSECATDLDTHSLCFSGSLNKPAGCVMWSLWKLKPQHYLLFLIEHLYGSHMLFSQTWWWEALCRVQSAGCSLMQIWEADRHSWASNTPKNNCPAQSDGAVIHSA